MARRIVTDRPPSSVVELEHNPNKRCGREIDLDGTTYSCARGSHEGIHDAFVRHADGGLVRW